MMKLMLFTFILVGFKIQDNLAFSYPEICYGDKCYDEPKDCSFLKWSLCETDDECGEDGECSLPNFGGGAKRK